MTFDLDCESGESTLKTLSVGFSCKEDSLKDALLSIDIEDIYEKDHNIDIPSDEYLYNHITKKIGTHKPLNSVCWFHLTRTTKENHFKEGVFPLNEILNSVWEMLVSIPKDEIIILNLLKMQQNGVDDFQYGLKTNNSIHWGPYAILVREVAFHSKRLSQHEYLSIPEIVEDICNSYKNQFGESIIKIYEDALVPMIVKFKSVNRLDVGCIEAALCFAYKHVRGKPPGGGAVTNFNSKGNRIQPNDIISVTEIEKSLLDTSKKTSHVMPTKSTDEFWTTFKNSITQYKA